LPELFCGIDWAEHHNDVALVDRRCRVEAQLRIGDDAAGYRQLVDVLADHGDTPEEPIPVAIETGRGLLVACLHANARGRPGRVVRVLARRGLLLGTSEAVWRRPTTLIDRTFHEATNWRSPAVTMYTRPRSRRG